MESIAPNIFVSDIRATVAFYLDLGFSVVATVPDGEGGDQFVMMKNGEVTIMFQTFKSLGDQLPGVSRTDGGSLLLYITMKEVRKYHQMVKSRVTTTSDIEKTFYGATEFSIIDINNYVVTFAEHE